MAVRVKINAQLGGVTARAQTMTRQGQYAFVNQVNADSNMYAPKLSTDLRNQSSIATDGKSITWNVPYARRQYYNYGAKFSTPGTGPKWDVKAQAIHMKEWERVVKAAMR